MRLEIEATSSNDAINEETIMSYVQSALKKIGVSCSFLNERSRKSFVPEPENPVIPTKNITESTEFMSLLESSLKNRESSGVDNEERCPEDDAKWNEIGRKFGRKPL